MPEPWARISESDRDVFVSRVEAERTAIQIRLIDRSKREDSTAPAIYNEMAGTMPRSVLQRQTRQALTSDPSRRHNNLHIVLLVFNQLLKALPHNLFQLNAPVTSGVMSSRPSAINAITSANSPL